jgi:integrase
MLASSLSIWITSVLVYSTGRRAPRAASDNGPFAGGRGRPGYGSGEYVASDDAGQSYHPDRLTSAWGRMLDELGIKRVRLHDARHSCATLMHLRQVPIAVIAAWLGHASAAFTMSVYAHSQNDALKAAASSFGAVSECQVSECQVSEEL